MPRVRGGTIGSPYRTRGRTGEMATAVAASPLTIDDMVQRAQALVPRLRERAAATEALGQLPPETVADFHAGGFFRVLQPRRFGGLELDYGRLQVELCSALGQGC